MNRPGDESGVEMVWQHKSVVYLCFIDLDGIKHPMAYKDETRWVTGCGINLGPKVGYYVPGRWIEKVDIRDMIMGTPTCLECMMAELEGKSRT